MVPQRIKQFYMNITDTMKKEDYDYVNKILNEKEMNWFLKLSKSEQKHSLRNATDIENIIDSNLISNEVILNNKESLKRASLLHDIGKSRKRLNVFDKSIIVILNKLTKGNLIKFKKSKKIQCYYRHSEYSYEILKDILDDKIILNIAKNHHNESDDEIIKFFKSIDDKN